MLCEPPRRLFGDRVKLKSVGVERRQKSIMSNFRRNRIIHPKPRREVSLSAPGTREKTREETREKPVPVGKRLAAHRRLRKIAYLTGSDRSRTDQ